MGIKQFIDLEKAEPKGYFNLIAGISHLASSSGKEVRFTDNGNYSNTIGKQGSS